MKQHPDLHIKMSNILSQERCEVSYDNLVCWFQELDTYLKEVGKWDVLNGLTHISNADVSGFPLEPKSKKAHLLRCNKMQITILIAATASGNYVKPLVFYLGVQLRTQLREDFYSEFLCGLFGNSPSGGWMIHYLLHGWRMGLMLV